MYSREVLNKCHTANVCARPSVTPHEYAAEVSLMCKCLGKCSGPDLDPGLAVSASVPGRRSPAAVLDAC